jgi:hypothetical protein
MIDDMRARKTPEKKKTAFVPRALFRVAITGAGVIPFCVTAAATSLEGCGNGPCMCVGDAGFSDVKPHYPSVGDAAFSDVKAHHDSGSLLKDGVADVGFTVADTGFSDSVAADAFGPG